MEQQRLSRHRFSQGHYPCYSGNTHKPWWRLSACLTWVIALIWSQEKRMRHILLSRSEANINCYKKMLVGIGNGFLLAKCHSSRILCNKKSTVFRDIMPYSLAEVQRCFAEMYCLHLQGLCVRYATKIHSVTTQNTVSFLATAM